VSVSVRTRVSVSIRTSVSVRLKRESEVFSLHKQSANPVSITRTKVVIHHIPKIFKIYLCFCEPPVASYLKKQAN